MPLPDAAPSKMRVLAYDGQELKEEAITDLTQLKPLLDKFPVTWLDVDGLADAALLKNIGDFFSFHRLAMEDVVSTNQRAKLEEYPDYHFIVMRMIFGESVPIDTDQLSMFIGSNFLVTFQEKRGACLEGVRERIRASRGRIRFSGPDYLFYALIDSVIDAYFPVLERYGELIDELEDSIIKYAASGTVSRVHSIKRDLLHLRRAIWPLREVLNTLIRDPHPLIHEETRFYLRDCYDHIVRIMDFVENYRELAADLRDLYLSIVSNRMNEIMKVLTVIATIFIPLTFIVGVYGMNFNTAVSPWNMPELNWYYGYPIVLGGMLLLTLTMLYAFYRRGWIGAPNPVDPLEEHIHPAEELSR